MSTHHQSPNCQIWTPRLVQLHAQLLRVLVVDDNVDAGQALATYLELEHMESRLATGGAEAVRVGTDWCPHVVIMDISMPECNGFEAAIALRRAERTCDIAIIAFTALDKTEVRRGLVDSEFDGYCQKGYEPAALVDLINRLAH